MILLKLHNYSDYYGDVFGNVYNSEKLKMKPQKHTGGYSTINLWNRVKKKHETRYIHRLIALTFISNPDNCRYVNHKDCNKTLRKEYVKGQITYVELGLKYGVSKQQIERIVNNKRWKQTKE